MIGEQVLCYLPGQSGQAPLVQQVCAAHGVTCILVPPNRTCETIGALLSLPVPPKKVPISLPPSQCALVLHGFSRPRMDALLSAFSEAGLGTDILKAVTTPTNLGWSFSALCQELAREHAGITNAVSRQ